MLHGHLQPIDREPASPMGGVCPQHSHLLHDWHISLQDHPGLSTSPSLPPGAGVHGAFHKGVLSEGPRDLEGNSVGPGMHPGYQQALSQLPPPACPFLSAGSVPAGNQVPKDPRFIGPYAVRLTLPESMRSHPTFHVSQLKKHVQKLSVPSFRTPVPPQLR